MELGFLIVGYTKGDFSNINTCISSIRNFYKKEKIIVVDNYMAGENRMLDDNVFYYRNNSNSYELGAILYAIDKHQEVDRWVTIHDSCKLITKIPFNLYQESSGELFEPFWCDLPKNYSPTMPILISNLEKIGLKYEDIKNNNWKSVCGLMFISDKAFLKKISDLGLEAIKPLKKIEAVCSETLFGLLVTYVKEENLKPFHESPISEYIIKNKPWIFIEKYTQGLGPVSFENYWISSNSRLHPNNIFPNGIINNESELINNIFDKVSKDSEILEELISSGQSNIIFDGSVNSTLNIPLIYQIVRHKAFTFKYFNDSHE